MGQYISTENVNKQPDKNSFEFINNESISEDLIINSIRKLKMISSLKHELIYNERVKKIYTNYFNRTIEVNKEPDSSLFIVYEYNFNSFNFLFPEIKRFF